MRAGIQRWPRRQLLKMSKAMDSLDTSAGPGALLAHGSTGAFAPAGPAGAHSWLKAATQQSCYTADNAGPCLRRAHRPQARGCAPWAEWSRFHQSYLLQCWSPAPRARSRPPVRCVAMLNAHSSCAFQPPRRGMPRAVPGRGAQFNSIQLSALKHARLKLARLGCDGHITLAQSP